jgi:hypothetical protein
MFKLASVIINFNLAVLKLLLLLSILPNPSPVIQPFNPRIADSADAFEHDDNLQAEADALLPLFDNMPPVPVYLKDEPFLKTGTNTEKGAAYTHCYSRELPTIFVKKIFYQKTNRKQLVNLLKHELTHAWLCRQQLMSGHDANFRKKFKQVGGFGN